MSEKFTASNGQTVAIVDGDLMVGNPPLALSPVGVTAMREFFLHERDHELGRWRWPEDPYLVVQVDKGGERAWVVNERNQQITGWVWRVDLDHSTAHAQVVAAARAYFAAHPEPKPWHDAKPGEVWVITTENVADEVSVQVTPEGTFQYNDGSAWLIADIPIVSARRIWPEVVES